MSKRRQKGSRNHRSLNLFEKGWLSAEIGFTIVKRSILKIKGPKINIKSLEKQCKIDARINYTKLKIIKNVTQKDTENNHKSIKMKVQK